MANRRSSITMSDETMAAYLEEQRVLNVATIGPTGHPHLVAMWYVMDNGNPVFWTFGKSQKVANLRRDPKITGLVEAGDTYATLQGVELTGTARIIEEFDEIFDIGLRVSTKYQGEPNDAVRAGIAKQAEKRVGIMIEVEKTVSWDHTKLGGRY